VWRYWYGEGRADFILGVSQPWETKLRSAVVKTSVYVCPVPSCRTIVETKINEIHRDGERPRCVCGAEMKRAYTKPTLWEVPANEASVCGKSRIDTERCWDD